MVRVYDADTNELIRQYPPDEVLALVRTIKQMVDNPEPGFILRDEA
ncbi:MAG: hypothetical protein C3L25_00075 [Candidatus Sedimenticola endophacoides]|uniref:Flagellar protein FlaG n=1 Tax=Candidatus Sedimenticola endophacoides TaxID=2548426 RepID=A0A6N4DZJ6_9GAMM|nr:MAG: hypothetical protein C3L24_04385 [Candidatus Sedimenticola endophacoides]PUE04109.1 MAG: hypothetical protein C3L26_00030 [Candidatus Sedimenticola endophacoides]PUE05673.1 MAG: hypothetical protein C3L25_00075 [Candidatus Sedimenticola endophacoides]